MSKSVKNIAARVIICTIISVGGAAAVSTMAVAESASVTSDSTALPTATPTPTTSGIITPWG
ncbi:hypothetical protein AB0O34_29515 [Sphaerisporangium sp. NPDC088356]|uniref:hypothetical protein n=1 Tax=Sphaerisporangium sp. NPDC088356 TaxID=3154871 RepID=UPI003418C73D